VNSRVHRIETEVDELLSKARSLAGDEWVMAHWAKYACVRCSGYLEESIRALLDDYARNRSSPAVANYVSRQLKWFQNPRIGRINELLEAFNPTWREEFTEFLDDQIRASIESIISIRHQIAHGDQSQVTISRVSAYWLDAKKVVAKIDQITTNA
jgi:hypothetical protein